MRNLLHCIKLALVSFYLSFTISVLKFWQLYLSDNHFLSKIYFFFSVMFSACEIPKYSEQ